MSAYNMPVTALQYDGSEGTTERIREMLGSDFNIDSILGLYVVVSSAQNPAGGQVVVYPGQWFVWCVDSPVVYSDDDFKRFFTPTTPAPQPQVDVDEATLLTVRVVTQYGVMYTVKYATDTAESIWNINNREFSIVRLADGDVLFAVTDVKEFRVDTPDVDVSSFEL